LSTRSGSDAERRAAEYLETLGYRILQRNYRCPRGEIDLVAEEGQTLVFVEVRMRTAARYGEAIETITMTKLQRILLTARHWLVKNQAEHRECRFDVVTVGPDGPSLLRDAFREQ
jgi:putative endonuclease